MSKELKVTSIEQLREYTNGEIVELPSFGNGQPFVARLGRPSLMRMVADGKIPNELLVRANELFMDGIGETNVMDEKLLSDMYNLMGVMAESTMIEPTYAEVKEAGMELTDEQLVFLFQYTQRGLKGLENFRDDTED